MNLSDLSLTKPQIEILERNGWTVQDLAIAQGNKRKQLLGLKGIGPKTVDKIIEEAAILVNSEGLKEAEQLAIERYYQKTPPWKIIENWDEGGLRIVDVALSSIAALGAMKGIDEDLAAKCISAAQERVNKDRLYESRQVVQIGPSKPASPAFPEEWLSGQVDPPSMGIRVKRIFEQAKKEYEAMNG